MREYKILRVRGRSCFFSSCQDFEEVSSFKKVLKDSCGATMIFCTKEGEDKLMLALEGAKNDNDIICLRVRGSWLLNVILN